MLGQILVRASKTRRSKPLLVVALTIVLGGSLAAAAWAATYQYCDRCTIAANYERWSNATRYSDLSYVHRLSGPSSGVQIIARAYKVPEYTLKCATPSWNTQVTCDPGGANVHGTAHNKGAGNYGFNAHLRY